MIGESVRRLEDEPLILGKGRFIADISFPDEVHLRVVRSDLAHGTIRSIDVSAAAAAPGVVGVWTGDDLSALAPIDFRQIGYDELRPHRQRVLAVDTVRYVGEPIAIVIADDPYLAEDVAELVVADIDPLEPIGSGGEQIMVLEGSYGLVEEAFAAADHVVELDLEIGRHTAVPMETRGLLARPNAELDTLELYGVAKVPHYNCATIAAMLDLEPGTVVGREGHVGGGFGVRGELYPEDVLVAWAAVQLDRPVKWIEDRREHLIAANHSRDQRHHIQAAVAADGVITAIDDEFWCDQGAYVRTHGATVPSMTVAMLPGPYVIPSYRSRGRICLSNKTPAGTYRSPGRYEATFACERLIDAVAHELDMDPLEVRRRNLIPVERMPFDRQLEALGTPLVYDSGDYRRLLDRLLGHINVDTLRTQLADRRAAGELVGLGVAMFVEKSGLGPYEDVRISFTAEGKVEVLTGAASVGQGVETTIAQICADDLQLDYRNIAVIHGQTDLISRGIGAFASRLTVMAGSATRLAGEAIKERARQLTADLLEANPNDLEFRVGEIPVGGFGVKGQPNAWLSLQDVATQTPGGLTAEAEFTSSHMTYPYGAHAAVVGVDTDTGGVTIERYVVAYDVGKAINPMLVEGQILGGAAQGIGGALLEEFRFDPHGQPLATSFMDYLMPTLAEMPAVEVLLSEDAPSPLNPLGVKGAGEGGTNPCGAVLASAIDEAIGQPGAITEIPVTPSRLRALV